jgi:hypothetical protein
MGLKRVCAGHWPGAPKIHVLGELIMRKLLLAACLAMLAVTQVQANNMSKSGKPLTDQQQKMKDCNGEAKSKALKGDERKSFMKECLSGE